MTSYIQHMTCHDAPFDYLTIKVQVEVGGVLRVIEGKAWCRSARWGNITRLLPKAAKQGPNMECKGYGDRQLVWCFDVV